MKFFSQKELEEKLKPIDFKSLISKNQWTIKDEIVSNVTYS